LGGHVLTSVITNALSVAALVLIGLVIGFRPQADAVQWLLAAGVIGLFTVAMTWISVFFGLGASSPEASGVFPYLLMGLGFVSSAFVPVASMPAGLAAFATYQPMTPIVNCLRKLLLGESAGADLWLALAWCVGICVIFWALSLWVYKRRMS
jgi:ABC-2 type transport system permease protein